MRQLILLATLAAFARPADARQEQQPPPPGDTTPRAEANTARDFVRFAFNFYSQKDGGGNPHLDEEMTVLEPQVLIGKKLSDTWTGSLKFQGDIISAASVESGRRFPPGTQSGASGDKFWGTELSAFYAWSDQANVGGGFSFSNEYDYNSIGLFLRWTYDTEDRNDTFLIRGSAFFDTLDLILFDGSKEGSDQRTSLSPSFGWTHILGPRTLATFNWDLTFQSGFLSTPYNSVVAAATEVKEVLPDSRFRSSMFARVRHLLLPDLSIEPGLGFYFDNWGATAVNAEVNVYWEAIPDSLIIKTNYRFHVQTEIDDFLQDTAAVIPEFRTQDSDMADVNSHALGIKFIFPRAKFFGDNHEFEVGVETTLRSDNLDAFSFTCGYQWRF